MLWQLLDAVEMAAESGNDTPGEPFVFVMDNRVDCKEDGIIIIDLPRSNEFKYRKQRDRVTPYCFCCQYESL